ncbi:MAG: tRNA pseudouridine(38-40) synthase TruA [Syntrophothermus sp.]
MNYKLLIQYDGTNYSGWQIQDNSVSIQSKITESLELLTKVKINLIGSGRTDSGVHALGQIANFRLEYPLDIYKFKFQLNSILPKDISIKDMSEVDEDFHSRFDAKKRSYIYLFSKIKSPFYYKYSTMIRVNMNFDVDSLNQNSKYFLGSKDFTSFCRKNTETQNKICNVYNVHWKETKELIIFFIEADRFLHSMVRTITGTILALNNNLISPSEIKNIFEAKDRDLSGEAVPSKGLFLYKIKY